VTQGLSLHSACIYVLARAASLLYIQRMGRMYAFRFKDAERLVGAVRFVAGL
jgi:hypothetical protein